MYYSTVTRAHRHTLSVPAFSLPLAPPTTRHLGLLHSCVVAEEERVLVLASWSQLIHALLTLGVLLEDSYLIQSLSNVLLFIVLQGKGEGGGR